MQENRQTTEEEGSKKEERQVFLFSVLAIRWDLLGLETARPLITRNGVTTIDSQEQNNDQLVPEAAE